MRDRTFSMSLPRGYKPTEKIEYQLQFHYSVFRGLVPILMHCLCVPTLSSTMYSIPKKLHLYRNISHKKWNHPWPPKVNREDFGVRFLEHQAQHEGSSTPMSQDQKKPPSHFRSAVLTRRAALGEVCSVSACGSCGSFDVPYEWPLGISSKRPRVISRPGSGWPVAPGGLGRTAGPASSSTAKASLSSSVAVDLCLDNLAISDSNSEVSSSGMVCSGLGPLLSRWAIFCNWSWDDSPIT